jgi:transcriptional regulator with XRE-family HTH domain
MLELNYDQLTAELLRALRGPRSQEAFRRQLHYRSNVAYFWESGRRAPSATEAHRVAQRMGVDVNAAWAAFLGTSSPPWVAGLQLQQPADLGRLLDHLRGRRPVADVARRAGLSRHAVRRWLRGECEVRLPDFLRYVEAATQRLLDWLSGWVPPAELPEARGAWERLEILRRFSVDQPWVPAVLRTLELVDYKALPSPPPGWIDSRLGLPPGTEQACLELLTLAGQIELQGSHYVESARGTVDLRPSPGLLDTKRWWSKVASDRLGDADVLSSYAVFTVTESDHARIREVLLEAYRRVRSIVAESRSPERVLLINLQLVRLDRTP